ncbi:efflux RND transporter permease subunit [Candidatus Uabimicrobium amorphum]|uniref:Acriflavin resistance protein n=1 Tax=Uabimicrobium amorphum TaxID=2596890 RepID=A0A5S9F4P8_UABAM|nr:efflux RND transporter permease subunit [Candidatus Uabimicrobium amorphum]BBM85501.1 acriflavin resistance protein [Candidatus Uabimicrobium amorphum]
MNLPKFSVSNKVAVNLLMLGILFGGLFFWFTMIREFFPNFNLDKLIITTPFPGATPEEVEKSVTIKIEREIKSVDSIENTSSSILEGVSITTVTLYPYADKDKVLNDLRTKIDQIKAELPQDTEDTVITELKATIPVISVMVYGDVDEKSLRRAAIDIKDDLQSFPDISQVFISGIRNQEIRIQVLPEKLEELGLTFADVGRKVAAINLDVPGGQLKGTNSNIGVRTIAESKKARELEQIVILSNSRTGAVVRLKDIAIVEEGFEDKIEKGRFAGKTACMITVMKTPEQDALKIADIIKGYIKENPTRLSGAVEIGTANELSRFITQRLDLMLRSAFWGSFLVLLSLVIFLDISTALWVVLGLAVSFLGTFVFMALIGVTINLMSLFALILVLGLVVDDAIIVSENIYASIRKGDLECNAAAIRGANEVSLPVVAAVLTSIIAFAPMLFLGKEIGAFLGVLPKVMIAALAVSLLESFLILPAHLAHEKKEPRRSNFIVNSWHKFQEIKNIFLEITLPNFVAGVVDFCLRWRYITVAASIAFCLVVIGMVRGELVPFVFLQKVDAETLTVDLEMASGTPEEITLAMIKRIEKVTLEIPEVKSAFSVIGTAFSDRGRKTPNDPATVGQITVELVDSDIRVRDKMRSSSQVIAVIRRNIGEIPGAKKLLLQEQAGGPQGADIEIRVSGESLEKIGQALVYMKNIIQEKQGVLEVNDNLQRGKQEIRLRLKDSAYTLGLTTSDVALQVRHALFGFEAQKLQENKEEIIVRVLLPEEQRKSMSDLSALKIATATGQRIPLEEVAEISTSRGYASLSRYEGQRVATITSEVDEDEVNLSSLTAALEKDFSDVSEKFPGITFSFEGQKKQTSDSFASLNVGFPAALLIIYAIIASLFSSYSQPLLIMIAIPYSIIGAILGHFIMQMPFTLLSMIGCVALAGVVVNDSLVLVSIINDTRKETDSLHEALLIGVRRRLRAILLTTITTVLGLVPLILEKSFQAQFLIPMAISLVFGLIFATVITLLIIPTFYLILEDIKRLLKWTMRFTWRILF